MDFIINVGEIILILYSFHVKWESKVLVLVLILEVYIMVDAIIALISILLGKIVDQNLLNCLDNMFLLVFVLFLERIKFLNRGIEIPIQYSFIMLCVPITSVTISSCLMWSGNLTKMGLILFSLGTFIVNTFMFYMYFLLQKFYTEMMEKDTLNQMIKVYQNQMKIMEDSRNRIKTIRHDLKHHLLELEILAKNRKHKEIEEYLYHMQKFMLNPEEYIRTGNIEFDGLVNYYLAKAEELSEKVKIEIKVPEEKLSGNFYLCIVLGNLLDNAVNAAGKSKEKYLFLSIWEKKGVLQIVLENSYSENINYKYGEYQTSEKNNETHGVGIESVKRIITILDGEVKISHAKNRFQVQIIVYMENLYSRKD